MLINALLMGGRGSALCCTVLSVSLSSSSSAFISHLCEMLFLADSVSGSVVNFQSLLGLNCGQGTVTKGEMSRLPELVENTSLRRMKTYF